MEAKISEATQSVEAGASEVSRLSYKPTSGVDLVSTPVKTTTILGTYGKDNGAIVNELGNVKTTNFGPRQNGFNVLNVPDELYQNQSNFGMNIINHGLIKLLQGIILF